MVVGWPKCVTMYSQTQKSGCCAMHPAMNGSSKLGMRLKLPPGDDTFDITVRLAGSNVHVIFKLQRHKLL